MDPQFQELSERIAKDVSAAVSRDVTAAVTANLTDVLKAAEQRLSSQATIHAEAVREQAKLAAEGYAATLEGINRRLDGIEAVFRGLRPTKDVERQALRRASRRS